MTVAVVPLQRFSRRNPCPICGGHPELPPGKGIRCFGFRSSDGLYAHCTREEHAGRIEQDRDSAAFPHRLEGACGCGREHGLPPALRSAESSRPERRQIDATFDYVDETGKLLYEVVRWAPKGFAQRRPDGDGGFVWNLNGTRRVPYRLPQVRKAVEAGGTVYVAEGEKCVAALESIGLTATCNPGGAGKWRQECANSLAGASQVIVLPDDDELGRAHADEVARSLADMVDEVKVVELYRAGESKRDVADFIAADPESARRRIEELSNKAAVDEGHRPHPDALDLESWAEFRDSTGAEPEFLVRSVIPTSSLLFLSSPPKKGKTWLGLLLALSVASGRPFLGFEIPRRRLVLYVALEGDRAAIRTRIGCLARGLGIDPDGEDLTDWLHILYKPRGLNLGDLAWTSRIERAVEELDIGLVLVDVLRRAARYRENDAAEFGSLMDGLAGLRSGDRVLALLHHFGKLTELQQDRSPGERMAGSGAMQGELDVGLYITGSENRARTLRLEFECRNTASPEPMGVELLGEATGEHGTFLYTDAITVDVSSQIPGDRELKAPPKAIAEWIRDRGGRATPLDIKKHFDIADGTLRERREGLAALGILHTRGLYFDGAQPAPAEPAALRVGPTAGQEPLGYAESTPQSADPAITTLRDQEILDLQGFSKPADPHSLRESTAALRGASSPPVDEDELDRLLESHADIANRKKPATHADDDIPF